MRGLSVGTRTSSSRPVLFNRRMYPHQLGGTGGWGRGGGWRSESRGSSEGSDAWNDSWRVTDVKDDGWRGRGRGRRRRSQDPDPDTQIVDSLANFLPCDQEQGRLALMISSFPFTPAPVSLLHALKFLHWSHFVYFLKCCLNWWFIWPFTLNPSLSKNM